MSVVQIAVVMGAGFIITGALLGSGSKPTPAAVVAPAVPELKLENFACSVAHGYTTTEGTVRNTSNKPIQNLMVVSENYSAAGEFIKSDSAMVEYQPLMPGQSSPFRTLSTNNPIMSKCNVGFKRMFGGAILTAR